MLCDLHGRCAGSAGNAWECLSATYMDVGSAGNAGAIFSASDLLPDLH